MRANVLFWPLVVVILVILAAHLADAPAPAGFPGEGVAGRRTVFMIVLTAGLVSVACGRLLLRGGLWASRQLMIWTAALAVALTLYAKREDVRPLYDRLRGNIYPSVAFSTTRGEAELRRAWDGHYRAQAEVNGVRMRLMIDTGASMVLLPYEEVEALGIDPGDLDFSLPVITANGSSTVAPVRLSSIKIGPIAAFDVQAAVAQPGRLKTGLLGMSFMDKLSEISFRGGTLTLRN